MIYFSVIIALLYVMWRQSQCSYNKRVKGGVEDEWKTGKKKQIQAR